MRASAGGVGCKEGYGGLAWSRMLEGAWGGELEGLETELS